VNGSETVPTRIQKWSCAEPAGITTSCPNAEFSAAVAPPNHAQTLPVRGGEEPLPSPQNSMVQSGVPKLVEFCGLFQMVLGTPPFSNPPSFITSAGEQLGDADAVAVAVAVALAVGESVGVDVAVLVGDAAAVEVAVGVAVDVDVSVGVAAAVDVAVGVAVDVDVSVAVAATVAVAVGVSVDVAVAVAVGVSVGVEVAVLVGVAATVAVAVGVEVDVLVGVATPAPLSTDPLSHAVPNGRTSPRWSVLNGFPHPLIPTGMVSKTGLVASGKWVCVGPPLLAKGPSCGSIPVWSCGPGTKPVPVIFSIRL